MEDRIKPSSTDSEVHLQDREALADDRQLSFGSYSRLWSKSLNPVVSPDQQLRQDGNFVRR